MVTATRPTRTSAPNHPFTCRLKRAKRWRLRCDMYVSSSPSSNSSPATMRPLDTISSSHGKLSAIQYSRPLLSADIATTLVTESIDSFSSSKLSQNLSSSAVTRARGDSSKGHRKTGFFRSTGRPESPGRPTQIPGLSPAPIHVLSPRSKKGCHLLITPATPLADGRFPFDSGSRRTALAVRVSIDLHNDHCAR